MIRAAYDYARLGLAATLIAGSLLLDLLLELRKKKRAKGKPQPKPDPPPEETVWN